VPSLEENWGVIRVRLRDTPVTVAVLKASIWIDLPIAIVVSALVSEFFEDHPARG
jgi:hypothetical protein